MRKFEPNLNMVLFLRGTLQMHFDMIQLSGGELGKYSIIKHINDVKVNGSLKSL